jgi:hypothetical protein
VGWGLGAKRREARAERRQSHGRGEATGPDGFTYHFFLLFVLFRSREKEGTNIMHERGLFEAEVSITVTINSKFEVSFTL